MYNCWTYVENSAQLAKLPNTFKPTIYVPYFVDMLPKIIEYWVL